MKTKRILAMLMAMCMLAACSMVVSADGETPVINYLSTDEEISGGLPAAEAETLSKMVSVTAPQDLNGDGEPDVTSYFSLDPDSSGNGTPNETADSEAIWKKTMQASVKYKTNIDIPAQKYLFSVWYKTNTPFAHVEFEYPGDRGKILISLPATGDDWKQFFVVWDAKYGTTTSGGKTYFNNTDGTQSSADFGGTFIYLMKPKTAKAQQSNYNLTDHYMHFCNPVLTPLTEDITGIFETGKATPYEKNSVYYCYQEVKDADTEKVSKETVYADASTTIDNGKYQTDIDAMFNILGAKSASVAANSKVIFKSTSTDFSVNKPANILLATYNGNQLTGIQIVDATLTDPVKDPNSENPETAEVWIPSLLSCTIPDDLSGEVKAFFWDSISGLKPLVAPATFTVTP